MFSLLEELKKYKPFDEIKDKVQNDADLCSRSANSNQKF